MRLAAGGVPVAVKRRAVEPVNKIKILPVQDDVNIPNTGFSFKKKNVLYNISFTIAGLYFHLK
jgi:hypothetical protein